MHPDPGHPTAKTPKGRLAGAIGAMIGGAAGLGLGKLTGINNFWLGLLLVVGGISVGGFWAQRLNAARR